ncbi:MULTISPECIES: IclR family transcriptional regulator [Aeribacillus]|uniref:Glycerol operon regulatory protein n=1 Tax=Aeribacillus pallidus TaxID=33936 RepID=A0A165XF14_9BACI|nr:MULTISPECIES: IclR family transcriptional regulator [Aeribacillus]ASS89954.1 IclR family transcriptional regulator [Aeribacillus pallidus]KZM57451.1 IclR family transcriptional regulator [Aeribacillus pallidus]KZN95955.1 IclR family transcriptional regulator [Aeribacillus pallidus]MDR9793456.1 IclR family transcriptional regulator [Aeribacillus pallidus]MDR9797410.1 IclR family transcriptional regulator [Aeribacillus pallidus]
MNGKDEKNQLSSIKNALKILKSFTMEEPEKKISDLSNSLGLNKSTVSRTMKTLASEGFVYKDSETKKYRLGLSILSLSGVLFSNMDIYRESQPVLNKLVETTGETAHISVLDNLEVVYLQKVECNHPVRFLTHIGRRNPPYCTSSGKVLIAFSENETVEKIISKGLKRFAKNTITDPEKLRDHLKKVRENGYAVSIEELSEGVNSIAAPIYDYTGKVIAALSVVGPKQRINSYKLKAMAKQVIAASKEISERMGYLNFS